MWLFRDVKGRNKLLFAFGLLSAMLVAVAQTAYRALESTDRDLGALYASHFSVALTLAENASRLNAVRALLLSMLSARDRAAEDRFSTQIAQTSAKIDASFAELARARLEPTTHVRIAEVAKVWGEFRDTRDRQLIPAIRAGRSDEARALASGIQAKRYQTFSAGAERLIRDANGAAGRYVETSRERSRTTLHRLVGLGAFALLLSAGLAFAYTRLMIAPLVSAVHVLEAVAAGDFTREVDSRARDEVGRLTAAVGTVVRNLRGVLAEVRRAAGKTANASLALANVVRDLSAGANTQAQSLRETSTSLALISDTVKRSAESAHGVELSAAQSCSTAARGQDVLASAVVAMAQIDTASHRIADVISTVDEIARQTDLLALNAALEAARVGALGGGFAVVAAEVRRLSQRAAQATMQIRELIEDSMRKVGAGTELVGLSRASLAEIVGSVTQVSGHIARIARASTEQSRGIERVTHAVRGIDQVTQRSAQHARSILETAQSLEHEAHSLEELVARFQLPEQAACSLSRVAPLGGDAALHLQHAASPSRVSAVQRVDPRAADRASG